MDGGMSAFRCKVVATGVTPHPMANNAETVQTRPTLLLTRPAASAARFAARLDPAMASRADLVISPLLEIVALDTAVDLGGQGGVIFTSVNGVMHAPRGGGMPAYCVGQHTGTAAAAKGWNVGLVAQDADALVTALRDRTIPGPLLHLSGTHQRGDIAERLTALGHETTRATLYDARTLALNAAALNALGGPGAVVLPLFSPRTAAQLVGQPIRTANAIAIAMSPAVARELEGHDFADLHILSSPSGDEMIRMVELLLSKDRLP
jgi:uroporphyrinogen-III synthase